ncbi:hypothetical protein [Curtobacterium sp. YR515]|uniref:hypothetical protein n=1 Tax=Curtobacterium sp. YR515 TaxID=1855316 RepID=UPI0008F1AC7B|nr:hypothetical protein [Curtobacterium sp. YR515]SFF52176.1 hypothetical protein SAMN05216329_1213 [Curtobacterium sp. YR515]
MTQERPAKAAGRRRTAIIVLVILATIGALVAGVSHQDPWIRWPALLLGVGAAGGSLALAAKRNSLIGWYAATGGVLLFRLVKELVAG